MQLRFAVPFVLACVACGDDGNNGPADAPITVDIDNGSCGDQIRFTGELVDWDSDTSFCGINNAQIEEPGGAGAMDSTAPNGRFDLCVPDQATTVLDVTPAMENSQCATPPSPYGISGIAVANKAVIQAGGFFSGRLFTTARQQTFFQEAGLTFDATKAHVLVAVNGTPRAVAIAAAHDAAQAVADTTWAPGETGKVVFFPNVDVGGGATEAHYRDRRRDRQRLDPAAGKITMVAVIAN